jgi:hypothetical protein
MATIEQKMIIPVMKRSTPVRARKRGASRERATTSASSINAIAAANMAQRAISCQRT